MLTTRNIFKREKFNIKNTEATFYSFKQFGHSSLNIGGNEDSVEVFRRFSKYQKDKAFKYLKNQSFLDNFK